MAMKDPQDLDDMFIDVMSDSAGIVDGASMDRVFIQEG